MYIIITHKFETIWNYLVGSSNVFGPFPSKEEAYNWAKNCNILKDKLWEVQIIQPIAKIL